MQIQFFHLLRPASAHHGTQRRRVTDSDIKSPRTSTATTVDGLWKQARIQGVGAGARANPWGWVSPYKMHYTIAFKHQTIIGRSPLGEILYPRLENYPWLRQQLTWTLTATRLDFDITLVMLSWQQASGAHSGFPEGGEQKFAYIVAGRVRKMNLT